MEETTATTEPRPFRGEDWFDPLEGAVRERIRGFIEAMLGRGNWTPPCSLAAMIVVARRMGIATATVSAN